jgi:hypothetical protein
MTLFILTETSAGYALLKAKDKKLLKRDDIATEAATPEGVSNLYVHVILPGFNSWNWILGNVKKSRKLTSNVQFEIEGFPKVRQCHYSARRSFSNRGRKSHSPSCEPS